MQQQISKPMDIIGALKTPSSEISASMDLTYTRKQYMEYLTRTLEYQEELKEKAENFMAMEDLQVSSLENINIPRPHKVGKRCEITGVYVAKGCVTMTSDRAGRNPIRYAAIVRFQNLSESNKMASVLMDINIVCHDGVKRKACISMIIPYVGGKGYTSCVRWAYLLINNETDSAKYIYRGTINSKNHDYTNMGLFEGLFHSVSEASGKQCITKIAEGHNFIDLESMRQYSINIDSVYAPIYTHRFNAGGALYPIVFDWQKFVIEWQGNMDFTKAINYMLERYESEEDELEELARVEALKEKEAEQITKKAIGKSSFNGFRFKEIVYSESPIDMWGKKSDSAIPKKLVPANSTCSECKSRSNTIELCSVCDKPFCVSHLMADQNGGHMCTSCFFNSSATATGGGGVTISSQWRQQNTPVVSIVPSTTDNISITPGGGITVEYVPVSLVSPVGLTMDENHITADLVELRTVSTQPTQFNDPEMERVFDPNSNSGSL